jgi:hypothetical protein
VRPALRAALLPLEALWSPGRAMDVAGARHAGLPPVALLLLCAGLGAAALPRLLALLAASLVVSGPPLLALHTEALHTGLARYVAADRLLPPPAYVAAGLLLGTFAGPVLATRGVAARAVCGVLVLGAAPLLVQRAGELAVVWLSSGTDLATGDIAGLPARFNVGVAGFLAAGGVATSGAASVVAEALNGIGLWVVALWGWGLARLADGATPRGRTPHWPFVAAAAAYAGGYALYALTLPAWLILVMGRP